jgi:hypothetical protein
VEANIQRLARTSTVDEEMFVDPTRDRRIEYHGAISARPVNVDSLSDEQIIHLATEGYRDGNYALIRLLENTITGRHLVDSGRLDSRIMDWLYVQEPATIEQLPAWL